MSTRRLLGPVLPLFALLASPPATSAPDDLTALSLEELLSVEVTSVSRKRQSLARTAASVYVISREDIRRSGARSIPEILKSVPGLQVAQVDSSRYAITARGTNQRFGNKLLVLMDGRTLYSPLFAGVFWSVQDTDLDAIERIEVIRGPGATLWGANAVNGVINIITRSARDTLGARLSGGLNDVSGGFGQATLGGELGAETQYRAFAKYFDRPATRTLDGGSHADRWRQQRVGLRIDSGRPGDALLTVSGEAYEGSTDTLFQVAQLAPPYSLQAPGAEDVKGRHLLVRWARPLGEGHGFALQAFYDRNERRSSAFGFSQRTLDLDLQLNHKLSDRTEIVWGAGYRLDNDAIDENASISADPLARNYALLSGFVQAEWQLVPDRWSLSAGSKLEENEFTGFEWQPSIRTAWLISESSTLWASVSRAVRTPSRGERDARVNAGVAPPLSPANPLPVPMQFLLVSGAALDSETTVSIEAGYRARFSDSLSADLSLFRTSYDGLRATRVERIVCPSGLPADGIPPCFLFEPYAVLETSVVNGPGATSTGGELTVEWRPSQDLDIEFGLSWIDEDTDETSPEYTVSHDHYPPYQLFASVGKRFGERLRFDLAARHVDTLASGRIDAWTSADLRLEIRLGEDLHLALNGRHLGAGRHQQFVSELDDIAPATIEPSGYAEIVWQF